MPLMQAIGLAFAICEMSAAKALRELAIYIPLCICKVGLATLFPPPAYLVNILGADYDVPAFLILSLTRTEALLDPGGYFAPEWQNHIKSLESFDNTLLVTIHFTILQIMVYPLLHLHTRERRVNRADVAGRYAGLNKGLATVLGILHLLVVDLASFTVLRTANWITELSLRSFQGYVQCGPPMREFPQFTGRGLFVAQAYPILVPIIAQMIIWEIMSWFLLNDDGPFQDGHYRDLAGMRIWRFWDCIFAFMLHWPVRAQPSRSTWCSQTDQNQVRQTPTVIETAIMLMRSGGLFLSGLILIGLWLRP